MKLDPEIVRDVLIFLEENLIYEDFDSNNPHVHNEYLSKEIFEGIYNDKNLYMLSDVNYAIEQLYRAGYISAGNHPVDASGNIISLKINDITWKGHQFLNNIRPQKIWDLIKEKALEIGGVSVSVLGFLSNEISKAIVTNPSFIEEIINKIL